MAVKPGGKSIVIKEQIIRDQVTGLTLMFSAYDDEQGGARLRICGDCLPFGNRDIVFNRNGEEAGGGTATGGICEASWLRPVD